MGEKPILTLLSEASLSYTLRRSQRATKTRIVVSAEKIEVVAPMQVSEQRIQAFVKSQQAWIQTAMKRIAHSNRLQHSLAPAQYANGASVPYQGQKIPLILETSSGKTVRIRQQNDNHFVVAMPDSIHLSEHSALIKRALEQWMKQQTRLQAQQFIDKHATKHRLFPRSLRIKTLRSRWGSCGPNNDINLNWLLMLAPPVVLEYVVVHELCHIQHKNHSKDFWRLVSVHMPDYLQHRKWLKQHGASLMRGL